MILVCASGLARSANAFGDQTQRCGKLLRRVAEHILDVELLHDAEHRLGSVALHADADHDDTRIARRAFEHLLQQAGHADAFEDQRGLERRQHGLERRPCRLLGLRHLSVLGPGRVGLRHPGVDHDIGAELGRQCAPRRRVVGGDDRMQPPDFQRGDDRKPDRPAADDQRHLAAPDIGLGNRVNADGEWLGQRGVLRRKPVRHFQQQRLAQEHRLRIAADIVVGIADARDALRGEQCRQRADMRAGLQLALGAGTIVDDLATELVAEDDVARQIHRLAPGLDRHLHHALGVLSRVEVRAADAAGKRLDQHLAGSGCRRRHAVDDNLTVSKNRSPHPAPPLIVGTDDSTKPCRELASGVRRTLFEHQELGAADALAMGDIEAAGDDDGGAEQSPAVGELVEDQPAGNDQRREIFFDSFYQY